MSTDNDGPKGAFVLGLDGVPWDLIERWSDGGELPNFARIRAEGASGSLRSTVPPTTPLAWPAIATGTWPAKHGVHGFQKLSGSYRKRMYTSRDVKQTELWDVLSPALVANVPMTYPASELDGRMVTGMMTPTMDEHATYPPSLRSELTERVPGYRIGLKWSEYRDRQEEFLEALDDLVDARRRVMEWFMETEDWRLFFFVYTAPDRLQHLIWDEETLLEHYRHLDDVLGEVMEYVADRDSLLFVVSDHGFGPLSRFVHVNALLEDAGYLRREDTGGARGLLERTGISRDDVKGLLRRLHVTDELLVKYLPRPLVDRVAENIPGTHSLYDVDHSRTKAFVAGIGGVYINDTDRFESGVVEPESVPSFKRELRRFLSDVTDPETGEPALEVFDGPEPTPSDASVPDLVVKGLEGYEVSVSLGNTTFAPAAGRMAAGHRSDGILLAWGSEVAAGVPLSGATVVDVAPTLLHGLGEPVGEAMDGRVLRELFRRDSDPARRSVRTRAYEQRAEGPSDEASASEGDVEERLRGLGYIE